MSEIQNHYLTPTYQSLLISTIQTAAERLSTVNGNPADVWTALRVLYIIIPPECKKEVYSLFSEIETSLAKIGTASQFDFYLKRSEIAFKTKTYLYNKNIDLFEKIIAVLDDKNYLEKRKKDVASNTSPSSQQLFG